jgi:hypothetical protein
LVMSREEIVGWAGLVFGILGILFTVAGLLGRSLALGLLGLALLVVTAVGFFVLYHQQLRLLSAERQVNELERSWTRPHITLLELDTEVRFHDKDAHHATQAETRKAQANYPRITEFWFRGINADGEIRNLLIDDKSPHNQRTHAGAIEAVKRFSRELRQDKAFTIRMSYDMFDSFRENPEFVRHQVRTLQGSLRVRVYFHPGKPCTSARVYVHPVYQRERLLDEGKEVTLTRSDDGRELEYTVPNPELGADYRLEWNW